MKKQILFLLVVLAGCLGLKAQDKGMLTYCNFVLPDNSLVSYEVANGIDIQFKDSLMVVNDLSFFMDEMVRYYFSEEDISGVNNNEGGNGSYVIGDKLFVNGSGMGNIIVFDLLGHVVFSNPNCKECVIDLSALAPNTLYVIKVNNQTIKFIRK